MQSSLMREVNISKITPHFKNKLIDGMTNDVGCAILRFFDYEIPGAILIARNVHETIYNGNLGTFASVII